MSALIGALRVSLSGDTAKFESGMRRAQRSTQTAATGIQKSLGVIKTGLAGLASGLSVGLFASVIKSSLEYAASLGELAATLGLTTRDLQTFRFAAGQVGISQEELENGIQKLTISLGKAQLGSKAQVAAFNAIGISIDQLKGKDTGEVFRMIAEKLEKVADRSKRAAVEVALFGKAGAKLDNLLSGMQGGLNELSDAAERLGIVLSDEQIQKADETADKLDAMKTVLQARVAGVVADNADAILKLADALSTLAGTAVRVFGPLSQVFSLIAQTGALAVGPGLFGMFTGGGGSSTQTLKLPPARAPGKPIGTVGNFLAGGGGGRKKGAADHSAEKALRDAHQFDQEIRRANIDILQAKKDLATDYVEQTSIAIQIKDEEKAAYEAELIYRVASDDLKDAQAKKLLAAYDSKDALERTAILDEEQAKRKEDFNRLADLSFDLQRDQLQAEQQTATTAKEQRDVQLRLLDLSYRQERARLEAILADEKSSFAAQEEARRRLANLSATYGNDRKGVIQNTQGPMEQFFSSVPKNAAESAEAMERLKVQGIDGAINSIIALSDGFESFRDTAISAIKQVIAEMIRMQLMKIAMNLFATAAGAPPGAGSALTSSASAIGNFGLPGFASGGSGIFGGMAGVDKNIISMNGLPIMRVSKGEHFSVDNDNGMMGAPPVTIHVNAPMSDRDARRTGSQLYAGWASEQARARTKGM